jgi:hypothetical protein
MHESGCIPKEYVVRNAIHQCFALALEAAVDGIVALRVRTLVDWLAAEGSRSAGSHPGGESYQGEGVSPVQRQVVNPGIIHYLADSGVGGFQKGAFAADCDDLGDRARLEQYVDPHVLQDVHTQPFPFVLPETLDLHLQRIGARRQGGNRVLANRRRDDLSARSRFATDCGDCRTRHHRSRSVSDDSED